MPQFPVQSMSAFGPCLVMLFPRKSIFWKVVAAGACAAKQTMQNKRMIFIGLGF